MGLVELPDTVRQFLLRFIDSVPQLEALLLMRGEADTSWDPRTLASRLYVDAETARQVLDMLNRRGLLALENDRFRYGPPDDELRRSIDELAAVYSRMLIPITHLLHSKPRPAVQQFADAFRLREKD
jgi:hypothetical protein